MLSNWLGKRPCKNQDYFWLTVITCLIYLLIQWWFISYGIFSLDDFWLAYHINEYKTGLPYRDFYPYKSVLGYYIFLIPMCLFHGVFTPLLYTKAYIILINAIFLLGISLWLKKFFCPKAILTSLLLIISTPLFFFFSSEIRVDLLAYWLCFISVLFLFEKKYFLAGLSIGLGFLICQKAVWYIIATDCGLVGYWLINVRSWKMIKNICSFNVSMLLMLFLYLIFWSYYSDIQTVLKSLFYEPYLISGSNLYAPLREGYWNFIIGNSIELVLLFPLALIGLILLPAKNRTFIIIYTAVILFFISTCKQPFVYFPLVAVPAFFMLFSSFFSAFYSYLQSTAFFNPKIDAILSQLLFVIILLIGVISPISRCITNLPAYDGRYQRSMIYLMADLLKDGGSYVAGVPLLLKPDQPIPALKHLIMPTINYMYAPSKEFYSILTLKSLYLTVATVPELIESIKKAPIKLYVDNNRFHYLPKELFNYLDTQYQHFWGSIYLYAPKIAIGHQSIKIKFSGDYKVISNRIISIDNKQFKPNAIIHLNDQHYTSDASATYRLELIIPNTEHLLDPRYKENNWKIMLGSS